MFSMTNLARIAKVVALLLFVLPWVTVSCADQTLITMTGVDLATGSVTMNNPMTGAAERPPGSGDPDELVIVGALLILLALAATFVLKGTTAAMAAIGGTLLGGAALAYTVLVRVPASAREGATSGGGGGSTPGMSQEQIAEMIRVNIEIGFWLVLAALAAAIVLDFLAMKGSSAPAVAAAAPEPPAAPPAEPPAS
jgi:hypothetical protein